jgi:hypothetical protein
MLPACIHTCTDILFSSSRFTKKKFEREARQKKNEMNNSNMALLAGLR